NVVADALSRKSGMIAGIKVDEEIIRDLEWLDIELYVCGQHGYWASLRIEPDVKIEHQRASGLLQPLDILVWKWDEISMDFVTGLPRTQRRHDAIWVVVDRLTKSVHFLPIHKDYSVSLQKAWGTRLKFSTAFHPQTDGQSERTIQTLEDMLLSCGKGRKG
nr:retrotransposon protein, putative, Ty3-gypsy subclass [Tanacetum cinerariifolium]